MSGVKSRCLPDWPDLRIVAPHVNAAYMRRTYRRHMADIVLKNFGCDEVVTGIGRTGVVGVIRGRKPAGGALKVIGLRADMDALPIEEETNVQYRSIVPGKMHGPAAMTATPRCSSARQNIWRRRATSAAARW